VLFAPDFDRQITDGFRGHSPALVKREAGHGAWGDCLIQRLRRPLAAAGVARLIILRFRVGLESTLKRIFNNMQVSG